MGLHEENAREIIGNAIKLGVSISEATRVWLASGKVEPVLTDSECRAISVNLPVPWTEIRDSFSR